MKSLLEIIVCLLLFVFIARQAWRFSQREAQIKAIQKEKTKKK